MQVLIAILLFDIVFVVEGNDSDKTISEKCMHDLGLTSDSYDSRAANGSKYSDDPVRCIDACLLKSYGIMKEDGTFDLNTVMKLISNYPDDEEVKRKIVETCATKKGDNDCDTAYEMMICMNEQMMQTDDNKN